MIAAAARQAGLSPQAILEFGNTDEALTHLRQTLERG